MTKRVKSVRGVWLGAAALGLVLAACGQNAVEGSAVTGVALSEGPVTGTVVLSDSAAQPNQRVVSTRPDGSFSVDVAGLTPPYMLRVAFDEAAAEKRLYAVTEGNENLDVNPITDVGFSASTSGGDDDEVFRRSSGEQKRDAATRARTLLVALRQVLAPLFDLYGITDPATDRDAVRLLLADVSVRRDDGVVTVRNRATGGVIFAGSLRDLASGTFSPENMPAGPGTTPPPPTACTYTYSAWGACASGTQTRTVLSSSPAGCTGTPVLSQACTTTPPPVLDGAALYAQYCSSCHGSSKLGSSASAIRGAIASNRGGMGSLSTLTTAQIDAIAAAGAPPPPAACTYGYSAWGACSPAGTQTRTVLSSSPAGCTGTPVLTQACTYVPPPPAACTYTYSAWGTCSAAGTQTRTVASSSPAGCTGTPVLSQACTPPPPAIDGAALYTQYCSGCHGNSKKGSSVSAIQGAIASNRGGMGSLSTLTAAQLQAISTAP